LKSRQNLITAVRLEELSKNYGIEIAGEIQRVIDEFCKAEKIAAKKLNDEESYCKKLSFNCLYLIMVFVQFDKRRIITLFPTNRPSTIKKFC